MRSIFTEVGPLRENIAPARVAAFEEARVNRGSRVFDEDVVLADGDLDFAAVFGEGPFEEIHRAGGDDRDVAEGGGRADGLGGAVHLGEAAAVGADGGEDVVFPLELDAAEGVAAAFVVGGEDRAADQFAEQAGRDFVVARFAELGDGREVLRVFRGELELAALAADRGAVVAGFDAERGVARFAEDGSEAGDRQHGGAGRFGFDAGHFVADADFEVGGHERGFVLRHFEFDVLQDGLRAAGRGDGRYGLKRVQHLFAVAGDFHRCEVLSNALVGVPLEAF